MKRLARPDTHEHAVDVEPAGIAQAEPAATGVAVDVQNAAVAVRVLPSFVQEDYERLLFGSRSLPVLLGKTDRVLVGRTCEAFVFQDL